MPSIFQQTKQMMGNILFPHINWTRIKSTFKLHEYYMNSINQSWPYSNQHNVCNEYILHVLLLQQNSTSYSCIGNVNSVISIVKFISKHFFWFWRLWWKRLLGWNEKNLKIIFAENQYSWINETCCYLIRFHFLF